MSPKTIQQKRALQTSLAVAVLSTAVACREVDEIRRYEKVDVRSSSRGECKPSEELCNGLDDDCDGKVDELPPAACSTACGSGQSTCVGGEWTECSAPSPQPESCNGLDDDCDGSIDENQDMDVVPCYPLDKSQLANGQCRFGVQRCVDGSFVCVNYVGPSAELCNGVDDDCDGAIDEGMTYPIDVVFAIDHSGSMNGIIGYIKAATQTWAKKYSGRTDFKIGAVGVPSPKNEDDGNVVVMLNVGPATKFVSFLADPANSCPGQYCYNGYEATIDAVYKISHPSNVLNLNWTPGAKKVIVMYTDEEPQSYSAPTFTEDDAIGVAAANGVDVYVFTNLSVWSTNWKTMPVDDAVEVENGLDKVIAVGSCR